MNHHFIRSVRTKRLSLELWLPLCFLAIIILFHFVYPTVLGNIASRVASPLWSGQKFLSDKLNEWSSFFASKQKLTNDIERLSSELEEARALLIDRELLLSENRILKEQFGRATKQTERVVGAILKAPPKSLYDTAIIDIGSEDGVRVGDLALSGSAVLGTVSKIFTRTSLIEFFSTAGKKTEVNIIHDDKIIPVEAEGRGGGEFRATLPKEVSVFVGDNVVMPGFNPLEFAIVEAIEGSDADSFQTIRFKNPVSIESLRLLEIQKVMTGD